MKESNDFVELKKGLSLWLEDMPDANCNGGKYPHYEIRDSHGKVLQSGVTCGCGRGCSGTDCIRDDWRYNDTDIEQFRA